ncbi:GSCOCG00001442001-RA-CDS [Cotesia congregata]|nr:GSCOCG00001442001-RA-CDS [Cotesia congregata]
MKKLLTVCSILILFAGKVDSFGLSFLTDIQDMIGLITDISDIVTGRHDLTAGNLFNKKVDPTLVAVNKLSEQINELTQTINVKMDKVMNAVLVNLPRAIQFTNLMRKFIGYLSRIDELYEDYLFYVSKLGGINEYTIEEFSDVLTSHNFGDVPDILKQTRSLFLPGRGDQAEDSLIEVMMAALQSLEEVEHCNLLKTSQQQMYELYEAVTVAEIKGHTMATYAFGLLAIYQNTSFDREIERVTAQTISRCTEYLTSVHDALGRLVRDIFLCDPPKHIKGETYVELNVITRIITHEYMMFDSCYNQCPDIDSYNYKVATYDDGAQSWNPNQPCRGRMYHCNNIGTSDFCELPPEYGKRYSWIQADWAGTLGPKDDCSNGTMARVIDTASWWKCHACFCECSEEKSESTTIRTISLRPQLADIDNNMVVTGVRFEQKDMMIHVQIEEGKLQRAGQIEKSSLRWKELEDFKYSFDDGNFVRINGDDEESLNHGTDYHFIRYRQRDVYLDNVYAQESGYVVTGLKMSQDPENSKAVQLDVYITPFNFSSGLLVPTDDNPSKWITHKDMPGYDRPFTERKELDVNELRRGDNFYDNVPDAKDFWDVWFVPSSRYTDAAQSTVPLLDRQTAAPYPRVALIGVSLFHRGKDDSAGFIGFKLRTVDLHHYMNVQVKPEFAEQHLQSVEKLMNTSMVLVQT